MKSGRFLRARRPSELADLLGLDQVDAIEFEFRATLLKKIIHEVASQKLTIARLASRAKISPARVRAIVSGSAARVPTEQLLRVLYFVGCKPKISFVKVTKVSKARAE
jgi:transcriptional regulator with XRE-family HTH domain